MRRGRAGDSPRLDFIGGTKTAEILFVRLTSILLIIWPAPQKCYRRKQRPWQQLINRSSRSLGEHFSPWPPRSLVRSEEHTSELQSRVDISYAVFCLKK